MRGASLVTKWVPSAFRLPASIYTKSLVAQEHRQDGRIPENKGHTRLSHLYDGRKVDPHASKLAVVY
jgi:hypothetical protein